MNQATQEEDYLATLPKNWRDGETEFRSGSSKYAATLSYKDYADGRVEMADTIEPYFEITDEGVVYRFHEGQSKVMASEKRFVIACAGRQGGKTVCGPPWLLDEMIDRGPGMYMVVAPSFPLLEDSALPRFMDLFSRGLNIGQLKHNPLRFEISEEGCKFLWEGTKWEKEWKKKDTIVRFGHGANASSLEAKTVNAVWIDEAGQNEFKPESFEAIEGRVTTTRGRILMTTTPYAMNALYRKYYLEWKKKGADHPNIDFISWSSYLNPAFPMEEYNRLKETLPAWKLAMFYDGQFTRPAGQIYDCFSDENIVTPRQIPDDWPLMLGMDFGGSNTAAITVAQNPDTLELLAFSEYLGGNKEPSEHIKAFTAQCDWHKNPAYFDRAFGGQKGEGSWRMWYRSEGLYIEEPPITGGGSVELGIDAVYSFVQKRIFKVFKTMEGLINQFYTYSREIDPETGEPKAGTINDKDTFHLLDCVRALLGGLARTSAVYEAALLRKALGPEEKYIGEGQKTTQRYFDPRYSQDEDDYDDAIEGEVVDEAWMIEQGIFLPGAGTVPSLMPSPSFGVGRGADALPLPF